MTTMFVQKQQAECAQARCASFSSCAKFDMTMTLIPDSALALSIFIALLMLLALSIRLCLLNLMSLIIMLAVVVVLITRPLLKQRSLKSGRIFQTPLWR